MVDIFPPPVKALPEADIPLPGLTAYLSQSEGHQILFMQFEQAADLPEHSHAAQIGFVLAGQIDLVVDGQTYRYTKGDRYFIPEGTPHSAKVHGGYADITFFDEAGRYSAKTNKEP